MRSLLSAGLVLATLLAGCAGGAEDAPLEVEATATTGVLRGVVVDEAIRPLARANITLGLHDGSSLNFTTLDDGLFAFDGLEPGGYLVSARKLGFLDSSVSVNVTAGVDEPEAVRMLLLADVLNAPAIDAFAFNGFLQCSVAAVVVRVAACNPDETAQPLCQTPIDACTTLGNLTADEFMAVHTLSRSTVRFLQVELAWTPTSEAAVQLRAIPGSRDPSSGQINDYRPFEGPSPVIMPMDGAVAQGLFLGNGKDLSVRVFSGYVPGTAPPTCLPSPVGCPWGVGASYEQKFQLFTHAFYGFSPPEGWQFGRDGMPAIPS